MEWQTVVVSLIGSAIVGPVFVGISKFISDQSIERQRAQQSRELQEAQNAFLVGATSHMATVVFDKDIGFCEEYVEEVYKALHTLIQDGRTEDPLDPGRFSRIRRKWALWLTDDIEGKLDRFEIKITQIIGGPAQDVDADGVVPNERSIKRNIADLRDVLHTEQLTALRNELVIRLSGEPRPGA
jgi:hypothetical protein